jgi:hypothetical protein
LNRLTEKDIETYVRFPERLSDEEKDRIASELAGDEESLLIADWFELFYSLTEKEVASASAGKPACITMKPAVRTESYKNRRFVLAAKAGEQTTGPVHVQTLQSDEHRSLMRILYSKDEDIYYLHTLSEHINEQDIILIRFQKDSGFRVSEPGGKLKLHLTGSDRDAMKSPEGCEIFLPLIVFRLRNKDINRSGYVAAKAGQDIVTIEITINGDEVTLIADTESVEVNLNRMVLYDDQSVSLWDVENGKAVVPAGKFKSRETRLFFYN